MSDGTAVRARGSCLCGAVRYSVHGALRPVFCCHCEQCRRTSGHFVAATASRACDLVIERDDGLRWYQSSPNARRGFCQHCGSSLFWEPTPQAADAHISIMAGTLDGPTGLHTACHIFVANAGDYYLIPADAPQCADGSWEQQLSRD